MLVLPADVRSDLEAWTGKGYPEETCGLLVGRTALGRTETARATRARNRNRDRARDRYDLDPNDFLAADLAARAQGLEIVGIWHSHPDHPARPSETDRDAAWEGWSYVIVEVTARGAAALRSWRLVGREFVEEPVSSS
jgi:proteasome lid subunit RPN8/RPN11